MDTTNWGESMAHIKTVVDMAHEPFLILDRKFFLVAANDAYCKLFRLTRKAIEGKCLFDIGECEWDIPLLKDRLSAVSIGNGFFVGLEMTIESKAIGPRIMMLNAMNIYRKGDLSAPEASSAMILLAMEDVTDMMMAADAISRRIV